MTPASDSGLALTITMNRIVVSPLGCCPGQPDGLEPGEPRPYLNVERGAARSTRPKIFLESFPQPTDFGRSGRYLRHLRPHPVLEELAPFRSAVLSHLEFFAGETADATYHLSRDQRMT